MPRNAPTLFLLATVTACSASASTGAVAPADSGGYSLDELLALSLQRNAEVLEAQWRVHGAAARLKEAEAARFLPRLRLESTGGLVPDAGGDIFNPPSDTSGLRSLGPYSRTELQFAQPLFTFGYLGSLRRAAEAGVEVEASGLARTELEVALQTKEFFYGLLLAQDLSALAERLHGDLDDRRGEISADDPAMPLSGPYKLELALLELKRRWREADDKSRLARDALAWSAGLPEEPPLAVSAAWLEPVEVDVPSVDSLFAMALRLRPDWRQLQAGLKAKRALRNAAAQAYLPQLFLAGGVRYAVAPNRTDQHNPFVVDNFNYFNAGVFLGLRQSFEWGLLGAAAARADAGLNELRAVESSAAQGIRLEVGRAFASYERARADLIAARESRSLTRQWLRAASDEYEFDPGQIKELVSAFEAFAESERSYYETVYAFNLGVARLEFAIGATALF